MGSPESMPALHPPPGQTSNFTDPVSILKWDILCVAICLSITTIVFVLRLWVRVMVMKQWILEDYMCCISYIGLTVYCTLMTVTFKRHGGIHGWDLTVSQGHEAIYWFNVTSIEYAPVILCTKLTVLLLYRRVFLPLRWSAFDITLRVFMVICSLYYISTVFVKTWECTPRDKIWDKSIEGTCIDVSSVLNTDGVFNTISDFFILLVPVQALWRLQMKKQRKIGIGLLFTVGLIAPIFSVVGWVVRLRESASPDITYNDPEILLWAAAELSSGIICTCLPTIPALLRRRPSDRSSKTSQTKSYSRHLWTLKRTNPSNLNDENLSDREYLELGEGRSQDRGIGAPSANVATDIEGGNPRGIQNLDFGELYHEAKDDKVIQKPVIMKTVMLEQHHKVRK